MFEPNRNKANIQKKLFRVISERAGALEVGSGFLSQYLLPAGIHSHMVELGGAF
jgi:hypothetical protein